MNLYFDLFSTPFGPFSIAVDADSAVLATAFGDSAILRSRLRKCHVIRDTAPGRVAREQVLEYFAGERREFDLPLAAPGTDFQQTVWAALETIPFGETRTYAQIAAQIGRPTAARAVGSANGANPICLIVPCHRVIGTNGLLTGFAFGEDIKRRLLAHERTLISPSRAPHSARVVTSV